MVDCASSCESKKLWVLKGLKIARGNKKTDENNPSRVRFSTHRLKEETHMHSKVYIIMTSRSFTGHFSSLSVIKMTLCSSRMITKLKAKLLLDKKKGFGCTTMSVVLRTLHV